MRRVAVAAACLATLQAAGAFCPAVWLSPRPLSQSDHPHVASHRRVGQILMHMQHAETQGRREALFSIACVAAAATAQVSTSTAAAAQAEDLVEVYFGCGCFWHVQHEFAEVETQVLGRADSEITSRAGYAGGKAGSKDGKVCYHNAGKVSDYGSLGHAEVVRLRIPPSRFPVFAKEYSRLFNRNGYRPDQLQDRGGEYRNLVGVPGGVESVFARQLVQASQAAGDKLNFAAGSGDDADARALVWIMDTDAFPFFAAEQYHQFHDGFNFGEDYPSEYNALAARLAVEGRLGGSTCPNGMLRR